MRLCGVGRAWGAEFMDRARSAPMRDQQFGAVRLYGTILLDARDSDAGECCGGRVVVAGDGGRDGAPDLAPTARSAGEDGDIGARMHGGRAGERDSRMCDARRPPAIDESEAMTSIWSSRRRRRIASK